MRSVRFDGRLPLGGRMELDKRLQQFRGRDASNIARNAIKAGLRVGARDLKNAVPVGNTKGTKRSIGIALKKEKQDKAGSPVGKWGANVGRKRKDAVKHAPSVLKGTKDRTTKKGKRTGRINPSGKLVFDTALKSKAAVFAAIARNMEIGIKRVAKGLKASDGGASDRVEAATQKRKAKAAKARAKRVEKVKKRLSKGLKRSQKVAKRTLKKQLKTAKRLKKTAVKSIRKTIKNNRRRGKKR